MSKLDAVVRVHGRLPGDLAHAAGDDATAHCVIIVFIAVGLELVDRTVRWLRRYVLVALEARLASQAGVGRVGVDVAIWRRIEDGWFDLFRSDVIGLDGSYWFSRSEG
jgi:hypothetical protein